MTTPEIEPAPADDAGSDRRRQLLSDREAQSEHARGDDGGEWQRGAFSPDVGGLEKAALLSQVHRNSSPASPAMPVIRLTQSSGPPSRIRRRRTVAQPVGKRQERRIAVRPAAFAEHDRSMRAHGLENRLLAVVRGEYVGAAQAHRAEPVEVRRADRGHGRPRGKLLQLALPVLDGVDAGMTDFRAVESSQRPRIVPGPEIAERMRDNRDAALPVDVVDRGRLRLPRYRTVSVMPAAVMWKP